MMGLSHSEMEGKGKALVDSLESTLAEEATWVEKQYRDLLKHYTQEQNNNNQAHAVTRSHLVHTLTHLFQSTDVEVSFKFCRTPLWFACPSMFQICFFIYKNIVFFLYLILLYSP